MTPWVLTLLTANVLMFLLTASFPPLYGELALIPTLIIARPWALVTYMFLHASLSHIFWNMLSLFFFGPRLEARLGSRNFIQLYLVSGLVGAVASAILMPHAAVVGASGAIFGVMLGFARYWPRESVLIWGVVPVPVRGLVFGMTVMNLWQGFGVPIGGGGVANFAHLGGFLGGWAYLVWRERRSPAARFKAGATALMRGGGITDVMRWRQISPAGLHPINREELERLQKKIAEGDVGSLTPDEKAFLNRMAAN